MHLPTGGERLAVEPHDLNRGWALWNLDRLDRRQVGGGQGQHAADSDHAPEAEHQPPIEYALQPQTPPPALAPTPWGAVLGGRACIAFRIAARAVLSPFRHFSGPP